MNWQRIGALKSVDEFRQYLSSQQIDLPLDDEPLSAAQNSPLAEPIKVGDFTVGNRWCVHPMEGWDATPEGRPSELTIRRWRNFGLSGCKLIWGGEAFAVQADGRANPNQLLNCPENADAMRDLLGTLTSAHAERFGESALGDLLVGLQLTHSGRFCRPNRKDTLEPRIVYHHPVLDPKFGIAADDDSVVLTDDDIKRLIDSYVSAAKLAHNAGFQFVDVKHCHGYLGHEFLSAFTRPGPYGGDFAGRTLFIREILDGIHAECPGLMTGVRLSVFDRPPYHPDPDRATPGKLGPGIPDEHPSTDYPGFGCRKDNPLEMDLTEPLRLIRMLHDEYGVAMFNLSAGSPYYNPHIQRPAFYPPSDGYQPPEDPLIGCVRQIEAVGKLKELIPDIPVVGSAWSYFQEYLPHVAQAAIRAGYADFVGIGRLVLSYWDMPADVLEGKPIRTKAICRTFSDCTTAPRNGIISGCFPLDETYKKSPEAAELKQVKEQVRQRLS